MIGFAFSVNSINTKSVEYRLLMRIGTHARGTHAKGGIDNQSLITGFSISHWRWGISQEKGEKAETLHKILHRSQTVRLYQGVGSGKWKVGRFFSYQ